jgi:hypothetical protein
VSLSNETLLICIKAEQQQQPKFSSIRQECLKVLGLAISEDDENSRFETDE